jgi:hypothetical protein
VLRGATHDELLRARDDQEEGDTEQRGDDVGGPEVLRLEVVVLREVENGAA